MKKRFCPIFSRIIEQEKCQGTFFKGSQAILNFTVELWRAFFWDLWSCWKHKFLKKKANFPVKKIVWTISPALSSMTRPKEQITRVHKLVLLLLSNVEDLFLRPKKLLKTQNLRKKQPFQGRKDFVPFFSRIIEHDKCQGSFFKGLYDILSFTVEFLRAFF